VVTGQTAFANPSSEPGAKSSRNGLFTTFIVGLSCAVLLVQAIETVHNTTAINLITLGVLLLLFAIVQAQVVILRWSGGRNFRRALARFQGATYISDVERLPNRNFMLAELRREIPRARKREKPFSLMVFSLHDIDGVRQRRGYDLVERASHALAREIRTRVRGSDFAAYLGGGAVGAILFDCDEDGVASFLKRLPVHIAVSDGRAMLEIPIEVRGIRYDLESIYASDVLRSAEEANPDVLIDTDVHWASLA
jgi:diguanylate cyclase (GGDEF)-like protein